MFLQLSVVSKFFRVGVVLGGFLSGGSSLCVVIEESHVGSVRIVVFFSSPSFFAEHKWVLSSVPTHQGECSGRL